MALHILSGGAAKGVVAALEPAFTAQTGMPLAGTYGAVGIMQDQLQAGAPCDVIILTAAMIAALERDGRVVPDSAVALGRVKTGIAVREGADLPDVSTPEALRTALLGAKGIYFPDPERATAGIHFVNVLKQLGIFDQVSAALRPFPNGATAMRHLGESSEPGLIGCTQVTEILYTPNVRLVAPLPTQFELATVYTAAVCTGAAEPGLAQLLVTLLGGDSTRAVRQQGGFEL